MKDKRFELDEVKVQEDFEKFKSNIEDLDNKEPDEQFIKLTEILTKNVVHCKGKLLEEFIKIIMGCVKKVAALKSYHRGTRKLFVRSLMRLCYKDVVDPLTVYNTLLPLVVCEDSFLRSMIEKFLISDIKTRNLKKKQVKLNKGLVTLLRDWIKNRSDNLANVGSKILVRLFRKSIITDAFIINILANCCLHTVAKVQMTGIRFMLNKNRLERDEVSDSESETEETKKERIRKIKLAHRVGKKSEARKRHMDKELNNIRKKTKRDHAKVDNSTASVCNVMAINSLYNPQSFAENLFNRYKRKSTPYFQLLSMELLSRIIGYCQLDLPNFYAYMTPKLTLKTIDVTKFLVYVAQAAHEKVSPDDIEPVIKQIADQFVNEGVSGQGITLGINTIREIILRCPYAISEELFHLLCEYKSYRDKNVSVATRSLINAMREVNPGLLPKSEIGRPTEGDVDRLNMGEQFTRKFGVVPFVTCVPGAEILLIDQDNKDENNEDEYEECSDDEDSDDGDWIDIVHSDDEKDDNEPEELMDPAKRKQMAVEATEMRIFDDEDFKKIAQYQEKKNKTNFRKRRNNLTEKEWIEEETLTHMSKKKKLDKAARLEMVEEGREERKKYGFNVRRMNPTASTTNTEKKKKKNYQMVRHKKAAQKTKMSSREKLNAMKKSVEKKLKFMRT